VPPRGVVVLCYHRVGGNSGLELDMPVDRFAAQMAWLEGSAAVVALDDALDILEAGEDPGRDVVVVTFDDGTPDFADHALPVLVRHRIPATLYVATAFVEEGRPFAHGAPPISWDALRDAHATGLVTIGSHTHTHALLDRAPSADVASELDRSIDLLGQRLGVQAGHFAYPKALPGSSTAQSLVRARFRSAAIAGTRANPYGASDPHLLARSPIQAADSDRFFAAKVGGGMAFEDDVRRSLNRWRYAGATS
jgi:peptidoglycan/xylan/chitin deacetylase (PgdA/CDA1 family)